MGQRRDGGRLHRAAAQAPAFAGVAPQGALVATADTLLVPGGRSVPAAFDLRTGQLRYFRLEEGGKGTGGSFVVANDTHWFVHTRLREVCQFAMKTGEDSKKTDGKSKVTFNEPVLTKEGLYTATDEAVIALDDQRGTKWQLKVDGSGDLIQAGGRLYAAGKDAITAIDLPRGNGQAKVAWKIPVEGQVQRLVAGADTLLAVTLDGRIMAFGAGPPAGGAVVRHALNPAQRPAASPDVQNVLKSHGVAEGYAMVFGVDDGRMLDMLLGSSDLHIVAFDPDADRVEEFRRRYDAAGLYGTRVAVHQGDPVSAQAPPYIANLVVVGKSLAAGYATGNHIRSLYQSVRPYGGVLWLPIGEQGQTPVRQLVERGELPAARLIGGGTDLLVVREGPLPGSAPWTHLYGNIANTAKSDDQLVKPPLGILWFGGNSNLDVLPRHGHGPCEQVVGGRLFIEGVNSLSARDVYTGRVLWKREFEDLGTYQIYYDETYKETPLDPAYNQVHIPGANARGTNYVATPEAVYLVIDQSCEVLDPATGQTTRTITLPPNGNGQSAGRWTYIGVHEDILLAGTEFGDYTRRLPGVEFKATDKRGAAWTFDLFASRGLVAFNRFSGKVLWRGCPSRLSAQRNRSQQRADLLPG